MKTDLINIRSTIEKMDIPVENVIEHIDCSYEDVLKWRNKFIRILKPIQQKDEAIFIFAYIAGHGVADIQ